MRGIVLRLILITVFSLTLICVIAYARGYRLNLESGSITPTGILATSSSPKAAKVYINGVLKGATDLNLTLPPGDYTVEMKKEGYTEWVKKVNLKGEIVMSMDALLFPKNPSLSPLTSLGIQKVIPIDQTDKLILIANNNDPEKDGIYVFEIKQRPLSLLSPLKHILFQKHLPVDYQPENTIATFSPDYRQVILDFTADQAPSISYLLSLDEEDQQPYDISTSKDTLLTAWTEEKNKQVLKILETFPPAFTKVASDSIRVVSFSPDETKVLYRASRLATIPLAITPPLIASTQKPEERNLQSGKFYIYDRKEDKNLPVRDVEGKEPTPALKKLLISPTPSPGLLIDTSLNGTIVWYSDSKHFLINEKKDISVVEYDGDNKKTIYSGPFQENFFSVTSDGKLIVLSNLNPQFNQSPDLYEVGIR